MNMTQMEKVWSPLLSLLMASCEAFKKKDSAAQNAANEGVQREIAARTGLADQSRGELDGVVPDRGPTLGERLQRNVLNYIQHVVLISGGSISAGVLIALANAAKAANSEGAYRVFVVEAPQRFNQLRLVSNLAHQTGFSMADAMSGGDELPAAILKLVAAAEKAAADAKKSARLLLANNLASEVAKIRSAMPWIFRERTAPATPAARKPQEHAAHTNVGDAVASALAKAASVEAGLSDLESAETGGTVETVAAAPQAEKPVDVSAPGGVLDVIHSNAIGRAEAARGKARVRR